MDVFGMMGFIFGMTGMAFAVIAWEKVGALKKEFEEFKKNPGN